MELYLANVAAVCGIVFLVVGFIMYKWPPKEINDLYGYRTAASKKSQEQWDFSQRYSALQMLKCGGILLAAGLLMGLFKAQEGIILGVGMALLFAVTGYLFFSTEQAIKKKFKS